MTDKQISEKPIKPKLAIAKLFKLEESEVFCIAISNDNLFGRADTILVSKDQKTWIQHSYDEFMEAVNNQTLIKVG